MYLLIIFRGVRKFLRISTPIVKSTFFVFLIFLFSFVFPIYTFAQDKQEKEFENSFGVARFVPLDDKDSEDGTIISFTSKKYTASRFAYDADVIGVVSANPAVVFKVEGSGKNPILSDGNVYVRITAKNGAIVKGDEIAPSDIPGVGMKATRSGFVIGTALEDYNPKNPSEINTVSVALNMHYLLREPKIAKGFFEALQLTALATYEAPTIVFRYFLAALLVIVSSILGAFTFAKIARNGIEALGRNPLAGKTIQVGILMNVMITVAIVFSGLAVAYFVLTL